MKIKTAIFVTMLIPTISHAANDAGCPVSSDEQLACEHHMCNPMGMMESESRSQCIEINVRYDRYLATLPPWENPARCWERDKDCKKTKRAELGQIDSFLCQNLPTKAEQDSCSTGLNVGSGPR